MPDDSSTFEGEQGKSQTEPTPQPSRLGWYDSAGNCLNTLRSMDDFHFIVSASDSSLSTGSGSSTLSDQSMVNHGFANIDARCPEDTQYSMYALDGKDGCSFTFGASEGNRELCSCDVEVEDNGETKVQCEAAFETTVSSHPSACYVQTPEPQPGLPDTTQFCTKTELR